MIFRWQEIDYEFVVKEAKRQGISRSEYIRRLIIRERKRKERQMKKNHPAEAILYYARKTGDKKSIKLAEKLVRRLEEVK